LIHLHLSATEALSPFHSFLAHARPYRDASSFPSTFDLSVVSCIHGLEKAMKLGWYDPATFNPESWSRYEAIENGDMNWLIPGKLLAFASPYNTNIVQGYRVSTPADVVPVFHELGITTIVRLNNKTYDEGIFTAAGFAHIELFFPDGSCPNDAIIRDFLNLVESPQVIALHCKAGLGRTYFYISNSQRHIGRLSHDKELWFLGSRIDRMDSNLPPWEHYWSTAALFSKILSAPSPAVT
jgi:cell division cycle 14